MKRKLDWADLLQQSAQTKERKPEGKGWLTIPELKEKLNIGHIKFYQFIREQIRKGTVERFSAMEMADDGVLRNRTYYRLVTK